MTVASEIVMALGAVFLLGLTADVIGRRTGIPRVTLLLLCGIAVGPGGLGLLPPIAPQTLHIISMVTLAFVAFLLGDTFRIRTVRALGRSVILESFWLAVITGAVVAIALWWLTHSLVLALLLGAIAVATDPIAVRDVVETTPGDERFRQRVLGLVAVDDVWAIFAFSAVLVVLHGGPDGGLLAGAQHFVHEVGGALVLGTVLGLPMAGLTGRIEPGEPTLIEAGGFVLLCAGLAEALGVSMLLAAMTMGAVTANLARHHRRPFQAIAGIEWPMLVAFFVLTGATFVWPDSIQVLLLCGAYIAARIGGRLAGGWLAVRYSGFSGRVPAAGGALLPQAGVALGVALVGTQQFPSLATLLLPAVVLSSMAFEFIGPPLTAFAVRHSDLPARRQST